MIGNAKVRAEGAVVLSREDHAHSSRLVRVRGRGLNEANAKRCAVRPKHVAKCIPANAREQCDRHAESRQVGCDIKGCASGMCCNRLRGDDIATPFWKVRQRTCIHVAKRVAHDEHGAWTSHIYIVQGAANLEGMYYCAADQPIYCASRAAGCRA